MPGLFSNYRIGQGGVNLVKSPLHLADDELTQAQNAELIEDEDIGGDGALTKRGGLAVLNGSALTGSVLGMHGLPVLTTYTRTMYAAKGTADTNTWMTSTNGSTWTNVTAPLRASDNDKYQDENNERDARRAATYKNLIIYPGNDYTQDTDNPEISFLDGTNYLKVQHIGVGPSGNGSPPFAITDILAANGKIYFAVHDPGGSGANIAGRVMQYDPVTGKTTQVLNPFGNNTGDVTGGAPSCMVWYQNQLWVGLNGSATTDAIGKIVRAHPDVDTTWTTDVSNLRSHISTMAVFKGDLYAGTQSSVSTGATITRRLSTGVAWATQVTSGGGAAGNGHYASMLVDGDTAIYCVEYWSGGTDIIHILRSTDGVTWSTDRDVDANDSIDTTNPQEPGQSLLYNSAFYFVFRSTTITATDGFIMERSSGGTYTKRNTSANLSGPLVTLVART